MLVDTNVLIRLLTGDPPEQARRARRLVAEADAGGLLVPDVIVAECVYVLESYYGCSPTEVADLLARLLEARQLEVGSVRMLQRALRVHAEGAGFPDAYLVALSEASDAGPIASFDRGLDEIAGVERVDP